MKTLMMTGAAALLGMTAIPAHVHAEMQPVRSITVAQADMDSDRDDITDLTVAGTTRFYSPDRASYAVWDTNTSMWTVYSVENDAVVESYAEGAFDPMARGWITASADADAVTDHMDGDRDDITDLTVESRYYSADRATYALWDDSQSTWTVYDATTDAMVETFGRDFDPEAQGYARVDLSDGDRDDITDVTVAGSRYYTPDQRNFVVWNEADSQWYVYDAGNQTRIGVVTEQDFDPQSMGWQTVAGELSDSDRNDITDVTAAGQAEERYYDADRATYGVFDPETRTWSVYDANSEEFLRSVPDNQYTRYERGYTVILPGDIQSSMSADTGSGAMDMDSDRADPTDVTQ